MGKLLWLFVRVMPKPLEIITMKNNSYNVQLLSLDVCQANCTHSAVETNSDLHSVVS